MVKGEIEALPAGEEADSYVVVKKKQQKEGQRPKAWESWDKHREHRDWQYSAEADYRDEAARMTEGVQEAVQKVAGLVQGAMGSGWWQTIKNAVENSGLMKANTEGGEGARSKRKDDA